MRIVGMSVGDVEPPSELSYDTRENGLNNVTCLRPCSLGIPRRVSNG